MPSLYSYAPGMMTQYVGRRGCPVAHFRDMRCPGPIWACVSVAFLCMHPFTVVAARRAREGVCIQLCANKGMTMAATRRSASITLSSDRTITGKWRRGAAKPSQELDRTPCNELSKVADRLERKHRLTLKRALSLIIIKVCCIPLGHSYYIPTSYNIVVLSPWHPTVARRLPWQRFVSQ